MSLVANGFILVYLLFFFQRGGVFGLAAAFVVGSVSQVLIFWPPLRSRGFRFRFKLNLRDKGLKQILRLTPFVMVGSWLLPINTLVNNTVAANVNSAYSVELVAANTIFMVLTGMFILSVTNVMFPKLSREVVRESGEFAKTLSGSVSAVTFILAPMTVGLFILRIPIVRLLYERNEFTEAATARASYALGILAFGAVGYGLVSLASRALYADKNGKTPMIITIAALVVNFVAALVFIDAMGVGGPALAATVSVSFAGVVMYVAAARRYGIFGRFEALNFGKMILVVGILTVSLMAVQSWVVHLNDALEIGIVTVLGILIYFALAFLFRIREARVAASMIFGLFNRFRRETKDG
jgi:murein biosynthesis integral membrane protein MurJ